MSSSSLKGTRLRLVLDTNVVVSGLLWGGHSRRLLELALDNTVALYSSPVLVEELSQTLHYAKLTKRITALQTTAQALVGALQRHGHAGGAAAGAACACAGCR